MAPRNCWQWCDNITALSTASQKPISGQSDPGVSKPKMLRFQQLQQMFCSLHQHRTILKCEALCGQISLKTWICTYQSQMSYLGCIYVCYLDWKYSSLSCYLGKTLFRSLIRFTHLSKSVNSQSETWMYLLEVELDIQGIMDNCIIVSVSYFLVPWPHLT